MTAIGIIPARYASTRFPGKPLADLAGRPMIQHVYERACRAAQLSRVLVATDDARIADAVRDFGGEVVMTRADHPTGTDRLAEVAAGLAEVDIIVNIQGDEPLIDPAVIDAVAGVLADDPQAAMSSAMCPLTGARATRNPNIVKVVADLQGFALYFSRLPIPFPREGQSDAGRWRKHYGLYAYRRDFLLTFARLQPSPLECCEKLEQLRALEYGYRIKMVEIAADQSIGVDTPEDLERAHTLLARQLARR